MLTPVQITVGGVEADLSENESKDITVGDHRFVAIRLNDWAAAKDMRVEVYS